MNRNEAITKLKIYKDYLCKMSSPFDVNEVAKPFNIAIESLKRKRGKWYSYTRFRMNKWEGGYGCTCCKEWSSKETNYCPNCGAEMRGDND